MQNQDLLVIPVQQQDYQQWLLYWLAYQKFYNVNAFLMKPNRFIAQLPNKGKKF